MSFADRAKAASEAKNTCPVAALLDSLPDTEADGLRDMFANAKWTIEGTDPDSSIVAAMVAEGVEPLPIKRMRAHRGGRCGCELR